MNRRDFLAAAAATTTVTTALQSTGAESPATSREYYELRRYHLRRGPRQRVFEDYVRNAWLPGMERLGIGPIGVFQTALGPGSPSMYKLIPYRSMEEFVETPGRLRADPAYQDAGKEAIQAPATDPVYLEAESWLLGAFSGMPKIEVPSQKREGKGRLFELRTYQSHNKRANLKKIQMFNEGEIAIFRRAGLNPVFFGETLVGSHQPSLTYMLVFDDADAREKAWSKFGGDPEWRKLSSTEGYRDPEIVTDISNVLLRPAGYSQI